MTPEEDSPELTAAEQEAAEVEEREESGEETGRDEVFDTDFFNELDQLEIVARRVLSGHMRGERKSRDRGFSVEFMDYRPYQIGDDLRYVDWNLYARLEELFIKVFVEEEELNLYLLVDTSASMGMLDKLRRAKQIAGVFAWLTLMNLERVTVGVYNDSLDVIQRATRGRSKIWNVLDTLATLQAEGDTNLERAAEVLLSRFSHNGVVVVVSDFLSEGAVDALKLIAGQGHQLVVIQVLGQQELEPDLEGDLELIDVENENRSVEVSMGEAVLSDYHQRLDTLVEELEEVAHRSKGDFFQVTPEMPLREMVLGTMRRRGLFD